MIDPQWSLKSPPLLIIILIYKFLIGLFELHCQILITAFVVIAMYCTQLLLRSASNCKHDLLIICDFVSARFFLQRFTPGARVLTDTETKAFLCAADDDSDGRIGADGERIHAYYARHTCAFVLMEQNHLHNLYIFN